MPSADDNGVWSSHPTFKGQHTFPTGPTLNFQKPPSLTGTAPISPASALCSDLAQPGAHARIQPAECRGWRQGRAELPQEGVVWTLKQLLSQNPQLSRRPLLGHVRGSTWPLVAGAGSEHASVLTLGATQDPYSAESQGFCSLVI